jgi:hypothetical protein
MTLVPIKDVLLSNLIYPIVLLLDLSIVILLDLSIVLLLDLSIVLLLSYCPFVILLSNPFVTLFLTMLHRRFYSVLPNLKGINSSSTLGEVYNRVYTSYPQRLIYPVLGWAGILYYFLWTPYFYLTRYTPAAVKKSQQERLAELKSLEFHQE